jgi:hypothetical protein
MMIAIEEPHWEIFQAMTPRQLGATLIAVSRFFDKPGIAGKVSEFEQTHFSG